jgi:hypothetical protein
MTDITHADGSPPPPPRPRLRRIAKRLRVRSADVLARIETGIFGESSVPMTRFRCRAGGASGAATRQPIAVHRQYPISTRRRVSSLRLIVITVIPRHLEKPKFRCSSGTRVT